MSPTISGFALATLLLGQTGEVQVIGPTTTSGGTYTGGTAQQQLVVTPPNPTPNRGLFGWREERPILSRIKGWFGRRDASSEVPANGTVITDPTATPYITPPPTSPAAAPTGDYHRRMPNSTSSKAPTFGSPAITEPVTATPAQVNPVTHEKAPAGKSPLTAAAAKKVGRDEKFGWITGQLEIENGVYVLYYATPDVVDQYNGRLVLQTQNDMHQFKRGDIITAEGQVQSRPSLRGGAVIYRADSVALVEHQQ